MRADVTFTIALFFCKKHSPKRQLNLLYYEGDVFMTDKDKKNIIQLRQSGLSYSAIAKETNLTVGSIKTFISRTIKQKIQNKNEKFCPCCGEKIIAKQKTKPSKFCSAACRHKWWVQNSDYTLNCVMCGAEFHSKHKDQKYCSHDCYIKNRYGKVVDENV